MYWNEKVINGVLHYRVSPRGEWQVMSIETLTRKYLETKTELRLKSAECMKLIQDKHVMPLAKELSE